MQSHEAFLHWYEPVHERFVRYCSSRAFALMETEDLVQESILQTMEAFNRIKDKSKLLSFMIGVANNIVRQSKRRLKFKGNWDEQLFENLVSKTADPALATDIQFLLKAIQQLNNAQQEALLLFEISGFSIKEISHIQESTEGAVKTRLSRARKALKELLSEDGHPMSLQQRLAVYASVLF